MTEISIKFIDLVENSEELKEFFTTIDNAVIKIEEIANKECWHDELFKADSDNVVYDYSGSNVDDAYYGGMDSGEILFARELLTLLTGKTVAAKE